MRSLVQIITCCGQTYVNVECLRGRDKRGYSRWFTFNGCDEGYGIQFLVLLNLDQCSFVFPLHVTSALSSECTLFQAVLAVFLHITAAFETG